MVVGRRRLATITPVELLAMLSDLEADLVEVVLAEDGWLLDERHRQGLRALRRTLTALQEQHLRQVFDTRRYRATRIGEMFGISRATVFRIAGQAPNASRQLNPE